MTEPGLWDSRTTARYFRVGLNTLYRECREGRWPHLDGSGPGGRRYLFRPSDIATIEALLAAPLEAVATPARRRGVPTPTRRRA